MKFDPVNKPSHWLLMMAMAALFGSFVAYSVITIESWDHDNDHPEWYPHLTLVRWIKVNQIDHVKAMLHELW